MVRTFNGHYGFLSACCLSAGWRSGLVTSGKPANFLAMCIFILARKRWPPASAHILTTATGLPALIAGTVTSWRRAELRALWRRSPWAKRPAFATARAARCMLPTSRRAYWAPTALSAVASGSRSVRHSARSLPARAGLPWCFSVTVRPARANSQERRVGKGGGETARSREWPYGYTQNNQHSRQQL